MPKITSYQQHINQNVWDAFDLREPTRSCNLFGNRHIGQLDNSSSGIVLHAANQAVESSSSLREDEPNATRIKNAIDILVAEKASKRLIEQYQRLGSFKNRAANRALWKRNPKLGTLLLLALALRDDDVERLADVSAILAALGSFATSTMLDQLEAENTLRPVFIEMVLRALRWSETLVTNEDRLERILRRLFVHSDVDVREEAIQLAARLPGERAKPLLEHARTTERDPELREELARIVDDIGG